MRTLTVNQKKILDKFINDCKVPVEPTWSDYPFRSPNGKPEYRLQWDNLTKEITDKLIKINDTEILEQEVNRYLFDECGKNNKI